MNTAGQPGKLIETLPPSTRSRIYHLLIFGGAAIVLILGGMWRGGSDERPAETSEITAIEALRKEVSGVQSALSRNELEVIRDAMRTITTGIAPSVVAIKPPEQIVEPFRHVPVYGPSPGTHTDLAPPARPRAVSGLVIDREGHILTSASVLQYPFPIQVVVGASIEAADLISADTVRHLALLKLRNVPPGLLPANLDTTAELQLGEWLVREGRAFSGEETRSLHLLESIQTTSSGEAVGILNNEGSPYMDGAVFIDATGRISGMYVHPPGSEGFVIPIRRAVQVATTLKESERLEFPGWTGLQLQELTEDLKEYFRAPSGVLISSVEAGSPAAEAGLRTMDLIESVNNVEAHSPAAVMNVIAQSPPETPLEFVIRRNSRQQRIELPMPPPAGTEASAAPVEPSLLIELADLTAGSEGAAILSLQPQAAANRLGVKAGDVILAVDGRSVRSADQFWILQRNVQADKPQLWTIRRDEKQFFVAIQERVSRP